MFAWILYDRDSALYNKKYIHFYREEGSKLGIDIKLILVEDLDFGVRNNRCFITYQGKDMIYPDFAICRVIYPLLSRQMELIGIKVFNNASVAEICNDKARTYQFVAGRGIPVINTNFYQNRQLGKVLSIADRPTVVKAVEGHGGSQVFLYEPDLNGCKEQLDKADRIMQGLGNSDLVSQPLIGNRHQDLRVYVIGKEIIAGVLRTANNGFKSNYSLGGVVQLYSLSAEEKHMVNIIIDQFDFGLVGIDFIIGDEGELIFNEIEDVVGSRMLYQCSEINIVERYLKYITDKIGLNQL